MKQIQERLNRLIDLINENGVFVSEKLDLVSLVSSPRQEILDTLYLIVDGGYSLNSIFDPRSPIAPMYEVDYGTEYHICNSLVELTETYNQYYEDGYHVEQMDWSRQSKIATFRIARRN